MSANLTKIFPARRPVYALDGISFEAGGGEVFGLLGPNGAGKTTTLRILATILKPTSGNCRVASFDTVRESDRVREVIGYVTGSTNVYDRLSAREMVEYFGRLHGMKEETLANRTQELFTRLKMEDFADTFCGQLSDGTRQKVTLARALIHNPPVLILDEPTAGLDVTVARAVLNIIREFRSQDKCIIFSTHLLFEAEKICGAG